MLIAWVAHELQKPLPASLRQLAPRLTAKAFKWAAILAVVVFLINATVANVATRCISIAQGGGPPVFDELMRYLLSPLFLFAIAVMALVFEVERSHDVIATKTRIIDDLNKAIQPTATNEKAATGLGSLPHRGLPPLNK